MNISIIIPVYNEIKTIGEIFSSCNKLAIHKEIILVDDGSTDGSREFLKDCVEPQPNCTVLYHNKKCGKGSAIRTGLKHVTGDIIVIQDADLEYHPTDIPALLDPIIKGEADVVYGSRFLSGTNRMLSFRQFAGVKFLTYLCNVFCHLRLTDMETCYKAFKTESIKDIVFKSRYFEFEPEITIKLAKKQLRFYEVPISYSPRTYAQGKKIFWKDGVVAILSIFRFYFFN